MQLEFTTEKFELGKYEIDGISLTANTRGGFTILNAYIPLLNISGEVTRRACVEANRRQEVAIVTRSKPHVFLVPKTTGKYKETHLIRDLINACEKTQVRTLYFSHYSFLIDFPSEEISSILTFLYQERNFNRMDKIIWEVDSKYLDTILYMNNHFIEKMNPTHKTVNKLI